MRLVVLLARIDGICGYLVKNRRGWSPAKGHELSFHAEIWLRTR